ncbi:MAG: hypothetical protein EOP41_09355 [Sphingobacteriaceae bacterium]|nr:MAG: hypothetical protein EOP41_09355 [Sphingobacteriaceae bacterium]
MDYYQSLVQQQKETKLQIDQLKAEYQTLEKGSDEAIAISATLSTLYINYAIDQQKIINILDRYLSYQRRENNLLKTSSTGRSR